MPEISWPGLAREHSPPMPGLGSPHSGGCQDGSRRRLPHAQVRRWSNDVLDCGCVDIAPEQGWGVPGFPGSQGLGPGRTREPNPFPLCRAAFEGDENGLRSLLTHATSKDLASLDSQGNTVGGWGWGGAGGCEKRGGGGGRRGTEGEGKKGVWVLEEPAARKPTGQEHCACEECHHHG